MRVLIAGAGGTIGRPLAQALVADGHEVIGLTRSERSAEYVAATGARPLIADALDRGQLVHTVKDASAEVIVHLVTSLPKHGPTRGSHLKATNRLRIEGTANLISAARAARVRRLIAESVVFAYGFADFGEQVLREASPPAEEAPSKAMKAGQDAVLSLEHQVLEWSARGDLEGIALRLGTLYGPGVPSSEFMLTMLRRRLMVLPGGGRAVLPWIALSDAVAAFAGAIGSPAAAGVYNVVDDEPVPVQRFVGEMARVFVTPEPHRIPYWLGRSLMPFGAYLLDRAVLRPSNERARAGLGWLPEYPTYRDGIRHWAEVAGPRRPR